MYRIPPSKSEDLRDMLQNNTQGLAIELQYSVPNRRRAAHYGTLGKFHTDIKLAIAPRGPDPDNEDPLLEIQDLVHNLNHGIKVDLIAVDEPRAIHANNSMPQ